MSYIKCDVYNDSPHIHTRRRQSRIPGVGTVDLEFGKPVGNNFFDSGDGRRYLSMNQT